MAFAASVSSLLFNCNPLLKYDGYYMLSDLVDTPNLQEQGKKETIYHIETRLFGKKDGQPIASSKNESFWLVFYNIVSSIYRVFVFGGIILFMSTEYLLLAVFMGVYLLISWLGVPLVRGVKYLATNPGIGRVRARAITVSAVIFSTLFVFLTFIPFPLTFKSPGVLKAEGFQGVTNQTAGVVDSVYVTSGDEVNVGDTLFVLYNQEMQYRRNELTAALTEIESNYRRALQLAPEQLAPISRRREVLNDQLMHIDSQLINLAVISPIDGYWYSPEEETFIDRWIPRGTEIGQVINTEHFFFTTAVSQNDIGQLMSRDLTGSTIRITGQADEELDIDTMLIIPMEQKRLPSSALGFLGGGEIAVSTGDSSGTMATEPFYEVRAAVLEDDDVILLQGRTGVMRFSLGHQPLLWQGIRRLRQLIQKNYKV